VSYEPRRGPRISVIHPFPDLAPGSPDLLSPASPATRAGCQPRAARGKTNHVPACACPAATPPELSGGRRPSSALPCPAFLPQALKAGARAAGPHQLRLCRSWLRGRYRYSLQQSSLPQSLPVLPFQSSPRSSLLILLHCFPPLLPSTPPSSLSKCRAVSFKCSAVQCWNLFVCPAPPRLQLSFSFPLSRAPFRPQDPPPAHSRVSHRPPVPPASSSLNTTTSFTLLHHPPPFPLRHLDQGPEAPLPVSRPWRPLSLSEGSPRVWI